MLRVKPTELLVGRKCGGQRRSRSLRQITDTRLSTLTKLHPQGSDKQRLPKVEADQATKIDLSESAPTGEGAEPAERTLQQGLRDC